MMEVLGRAHTDPALLPEQLGVGWGGNRKGQLTFTVFTQKSLLPHSQQGFPSWGVAGRGLLNTERESVRGR